MSSSDQRIAEKRAHELQVGDRVLQLHEDGERRPAKITDVFPSEEGDMVDVLYDNGRGSCFGRNDRVRVLRGGES